MGLLQSTMNDVIYCNLNIFSIFKKKIVYKSIIFYTKSIYLIYKSKIFKFEVLKPFLCFVFFK